MPINNELVCCVILLYLINLIFNGIKTCYSFTFFHQKLYCITFFSQTALVCVGNRQRPTAEIETEKAKQIANESAIEMHISLGSFSFDASEVLAS